MTTLREATIQALEALELIDKEFKKHGRHHWPEAVKARNAAPALRAALEETPTNQCGETCERAKLCAACARELAEPNPKPLAEWQINDLIADIDPEDVCSWSFRQGVYAAEKHHGVKP